MGKMCYRCMMPTVEGGVCRRCGEPDISAQGNGPKALPPGTVLCGGRITVGKKLGSGGFGITYIAFDQKLNRRVALKEFLPNYLVEREGKNLVPKSGSNDAYVKAMNSFHKEARALLEVRGHPNIVHVISTFRENNTAYYTMELLEGESLLAFLKKRKKISGEEAFRMLFPIMDAIRYMHRRKMLHRDISPDNIMLCYDPDNSRRMIPKLIDFGAAHVAIEGFSASYPGVKKNGFSPLEQNWEGKYQGPWTDVYALCATFYGAVIGTVPMPAVDRAEQKNSSARGEDPLKSARQCGADITEGMDEVLMKGLALNYQDRIQSMDELMARMTEARNKSTNETIIDLPTVQPAQATRPAGRRVGAWITETVIHSGAAAACAMVLPLMMSWIPVLLLFLLNWVLLMTARGTLGQLIWGLKVQRDDTSGKAMGAGFCLLYALFYPGLIGLICGIIFLASGKNIGPLEGMCGGTVMRRSESGSVSLGSVVISKSVARPESTPNRAGSGGQASPQPQPRPQPQPQPQQQKTPQQAPVKSGGNPPAKEPSAASPGKTAHLAIQAATEALSNLVGKGITIHSGDTLGKNGTKSKIVLADPTISGLHCRFVYQQGRGWLIKDENSTNGTIVNDQRLPAGGMAPLKLGAVIKIGKEQLEFRT